MDAGERGVGGPQLRFDRRIVLVEQCEEHVLDAHVVVVVVAALLFGGPQDAPRCRAKTGKQSANACKRESGRDGRI